MAFPIGVTLVDMLRRWAKSTPDKIAAVDDCSSLTFAQWNDLSDKLAAKLILSGVQPNTFIGVLFERKLDYLIAAMAVFKCAAAIVPFDEHLPIQRMEYMLGVSQAPLLITHSQILNQKRQEGEFKTPPVFCIDQQSWRNIPVAYLPNVTPENYSHMIFTSGSTGVPKGVYATHRQLTSAIQMFNYVCRFQQTDEILANASFCFVAGLDVFFPLGVGATVHIMPYFLRKDLTRLTGYLSEKRISGGLFPGLLGPDLARQYKLPLRFMALAGLRAESLPDISTSLINMFGCTETTTLAVTHDFLFQRDKDNIPIGKPSPNTWVYLVNEPGNLVQPGEKGELWVAGTQVACGYYNQPELTAKKFIRNPFATCTENQIAFITGDICRLNSNGFIEYCGRRDLQVKVRGCRIELEGVEAIFYKFPGITAAVCSVKKVNSTEQIIGYYTAQSAIDKIALRKFLRSFLPGYMVPKILIQLSSMPLTATGKIDRQYLPEPEIFEL